MKLALVTTPPSARSAIGAYTRNLVREMSKLCEVELFVERGREGESYDGRATRSAHTLRPREFDQVLYQLGNERQHAFMAPMLRALGGTVALHDWVLFDLALAAFPELERGGWKGHVRALREGGIEQARAYFAQRRDHKYVELPLNRSVVRFGDSFLVHSEHVRRAIIEERNAPTPTGIVPHGADALWRDEDRRIERERLGLPAQFRDAFLLTGFVTAQAHERIDVVLRALSLARKSRPSTRLVLVATVDREPVDARALVQPSDLEDSVFFTERADEALGRRYVHAGDLGVQLSHASSEPFQTLALGRGVIASDAPEFRELPSSCVLKLTSGTDEAERLAALLVELHDHSERRTELERAAREFVERECGWPLVAAKYFDLLGRFPPPRTARKSLIGHRIAQALSDKRASSSR